MMGWCTTARNMTTLLGIQWSCDLLWFSKIHGDQIEFGKILTVLSWLCSFLFLLPPNAASPLYDGFTSGLKGFFWYLCVAIRWPGVVAGRQVIFFGRTMWAFWGFDSVYKSFFSETSCTNTPVWQVPDDFQLPLASKLLAMCDPHPSRTRLDTCFCFQEIGSQCWLSYHDGHIVFLGKGNLTRL